MLNVKAPRELLASQLESRTTKSESQATFGHASRPAVMYREIQRNNCPYIRACKHEEFALSSVSTLPGLALL
jgi:hypothetical protein